MKVLHGQQAKYYHLCIDTGIVDHSEIIDWADKLIQSGISDENLIDISLTKNIYDIKANLHSISRDIDLKGIVESFLINQIKSHNSDHNMLNKIFRQFWHNDHISPDLITYLYQFDHYVDDCYETDTSKIEYKVLDDILLYCKNNCTIELLS